MVARLIRLFASVTAEDVQQKGTLAAVAPFRPPAPGDP